MKTSDTITSKYQITIGIECHVQLATATKLFSGADNDARDKAPNTVVSPIDFGLPGMLPVLNREAVNLAIKAGKALNSEIARVSRFDRKHYFYPDLPKGYQTTQMYNPIIVGGFVDAPLEDGSSVRVRLHHAHMEEDAGKLTHFSTFSLVDLNRAGTPLIEIVSEPDIHSAAEAKAYATELYRLMTYAGVTHGDLYHGNMRFDVNVSAALKGATELGTRAEVKNLNSFKSVERAAEYEFERQVELLEKGEKIVQETRGWDEAKQKTNSQRSKEDAQDYRYMPDADIPPIVLSEEEIKEIQSTVPLLPSYYREAWKGIDFDSTTINAVLLDKRLAEKLEAVRKESDNESAKKVGFWLLAGTHVADLSAENNKSQVINKILNIRNDYLIMLSKMVKKDQLNSNASDTIFFEMINSSSDPLSIATEKDLIQVSDEGAIAAIVDEVLTDPASAQAVKDLREGSDKVIGFLVGQVMKKSGGKANPSLAQKLIRERVQ
ncbi:Asp-tRNA(Asn)/Glu-tRNA(Gln) amidotransferase subunit GatB [soil metagenome]